MTNQNISEWTSSMLATRIAEIETELEKLWIDYCDKKCNLINEKEYLQAELGNRRFTGLMREVSQ